MNSQKLSQSLKIGIFLILISASFLITKNSQACTVFETLGDGCYSGGINCGTSQWDTTSAWLCGIEINPSVIWCLNWGAPGYVVDGDGECQNSNVWLKSNGCPNTNLYNGATCLLADSAVDACGFYVCSEQGAPLRGTWDASQQQCITCNGSLQGELIADAVGAKCFDFKETAGPCLFSSNVQWVDNGCGALYPSCESACGASPQCDEASFGIGVGVSGGVCNNCIFAVATAEICNNIVDDDGDGLIDCADPDCAADPACLTTPSCPAECPCPNGTIGAAGGSPQGLVPCGRKADDLATNVCECCPCTLCHFFVLLKRIVDFATISILFPLAVLMIVVGGIMFLTATGSPGKIGTAKKILTTTVIGIFIVLASWLIIDTVVAFMTPAGSIFQNWETINCPVP